MRLLPDFSAYPTLRASDGNLVGLLELDEAD
jgi:hypothetical protein